MVSRLGGLERGQRARAPHEQGHRHVRKEHDVAQGQYREPIGRFDHLGVAQEALSHALRITPRLRIGIADSDPGF